MFLIHYKNFKLMGTTVSEIAGGSAEPSPPPLVKGVGTKALIKKGLNIQQRQIVVTRGECKTSNTRENIKCESIPDQSTGIQATKFC